MNEIFDFLRASCSSVRSKRFFTFLKNLFSWFSVICVCRPSFSYSRRIRLVRWGQVWTCMLSTPRKYSMWINFRNEPKDVCWFQLWFQQNLLSFRELFFGDLLSACTCVWKTPVERLYTTGSWVLLDDSVWYFIQHRVVRNSNHKNNSVNQIVHRRIQH